MYKNKICVIGTGYVGLVGGVCLADFGNRIMNVDIDEKKIKMLQDENIPIYEPGLQVLFERNVREKRIKFTTDIARAIKECEVIYISVGTPSSQNGESNLESVFQVAKNIGQIIDGYRIIVTKSTVPVGTGRKVEAIINEEINKRNKDYKIDIVSNPEFLREGKAVYDFTHPDRIVIGTDSENARKVMEEVYRPLYLNNTPFVFTNLETAEMIKYAANAFLATKISFINEMANLCEAVDADVQTVARSMGMDGRISSKFLHAGPGYGGSCFPKDTRAIVKIGEASGVDMKVIKAAIIANENQKIRMVDKIRDRLGGLRGKTISILGLTFKPETDDVREAPALSIIPRLIKSGARIRAYDPQGMKTASRILNEYEQEITYCKNEYEAVKKADALVLITEWNQFRRLDLDRVRSLLAYPVFFDLRNVYIPEEVEAVGIEYIGVGVKGKKISAEIETGKREIAATEQGVKDN